MKRLMQRWRGLPAPVTRLPHQFSPGIARGPPRARGFCTVGERRRRSSGQPARAAIIQADGNGQDNTITLQPGVYQLSLANTNGQENGAAQGDLDLTGANHTVTIQGAGAGVSVIDGGKLDRVFQVLGNVTAVFRDLTIRNGNAQDDGVPGSPFVTPDARGGGILNAGNLTLDHVVVEGNAAFGDDGTNGGMLSDGSAGQAGEGGGIYSSGSLSLIDSTVSDNIAQGGYGGDGGIGNVYIKDNGGAGGALSGGGIFASGSLSVVQSTISGDQSLGGNGGQGDSAGVFGGDGGDGGAAVGGGLAIATGASSVVITNSTISGNEAVSGAGGNGGLAAASFAKGGDGGNGGNALGGGIDALVTFSLNNSTVAANNAFGSRGGAFGFPSSALGTAGSPGFAGSSAGGGVDGYGFAVVNSVSSLIADNTTGLQAPDFSGTFGVAMNNLLGSGDGAAAITNGVNGNIVGQDPKLGPLQDNGGPTFTQALLPGSPAINAGTNPDGLTTDQRGYISRSVGGATDIGAYEAGATAPTMPSPPGMGTPGPGQPGKGTPPPNPPGMGMAQESITVSVVKVHGHREIVVFDAATGAQKFAVYPFGKSFKGNFQVVTRDVNGDGVPDVIASFNRKHKVVNTVFSGRDGSSLPASLVV